MTYADIYYGAYRAFKSAEEANPIRDREKIRDAISAAGADGDVCEYHFSLCTIESDWVEAIEEGLSHIEKTIEAQRRFIKYEGETVRIEKAKRTGIESVKHLSRHSNLIKEKREDGVMPEKIYVVENEENFAVYENRFIYMLLTMLNDFVSIRYSAITDAKTRARYLLSAKRSIVAVGRKISYGISFDEQSSRIDLDKSEINDPLYGRVANILATIVSFLESPLMTLVSQAPMLKPPIVRTNVIKMNPHFFAAHELYTFILAYDKDGYTVDEITDRLDSSSEHFADILCDNLLFGANSAYIGSERIGRYLKGAYERAEEERRAKAEAERGERLAALKEGLESGKTEAAEYISELENALDASRDENGMLLTRISSLDNEYQKLMKSFEGAERMNARLIQENEENLLRAETAEKRTSTAIFEINSKHTAELAEQREKFALDKEEFKKELARMNEQIELIKADCARHIKELETEFDSRIRAARLAKGEGADEDNSVFREDFIKLEAEKAAFDKYYKLQWASAKKNIRKKLLWNKPVEKKNQENPIDSEPAGEKKEKEEQDG